MNWQKSISLSRARLGAVETARWEMPSVVMDVRTLVSQHLNSSPGKKFDFRIMMFNCKQYMVLGYKGDLSLVLAGLSSKFCKVIRLGSA